MKIVNKIAVHTQVNDKTCKLLYAISMLIKTDSYKDAKSLRFFNDRLEHQSRQQQQFMFLR